MMKLSKLLLVATSALLIVLAPTVMARDAGKERANTPVIFGHRGGRKWAPENTLASFSRCVENGYGIELDIHKCKTGELVVIHDDDISRTTNGTGFVKDKTLSELRAVSAGKWFAPNFEGERIPLLTEVLSLVDGKVPIQIEIKNQPIKYEGIERDLYDLLKSYKAPNAITVISFDHEVLHQFHKLAPQYKVGFLDCAIPYDIGGYSKAIGATAWHPDFSSLRKEDVTRAHAAHISVSPWTVNQPNEWRSMLTDGVDAIVTDDPAGLHKFLLGAHQ